MLGRWVERHEAVPLANVELSRMYCCKHIRKANAAKIQICRFCLFDVFSRIRRACSLPGPVEARIRGSHPFNSILLLLAVFDVRSLDPAAAV